MMSFFNCCSINRLCLDFGDFALFVRSSSVVMRFLAEKIRSGVFCDNDIEAVLCNVWRCPSLLCRRTSVAMVEKNRCYLHTYREKSRRSNFRSRKKATLPSQSRLLALTKTSNHLDSQITSETPESIKSNKLKR